MRLILCFFALLLCTSVRAQNVANVDHDGPALVYQAETTTETVDLQLNGRERTLLGDLDLSGVWAGPTYNYSSTGDDWALMRGGFGGLEFGEDFFIGYGGWKNREAFTTDDPVAESPTYDFKHGGLILAYTPFADNAIHPRISAVFGPGRIQLEGADNASDRFLVGQAAAGLELNLFQWFRLGVEGGYRFASGVDPVSDDVSKNITANDIGGAFVQLEARFGFSW